MTHERTPRLRDRPPRTYTTGRVINSVRVATVLVALATVAVIVFRYPLLAESIPTHFNASGQPDDWGPKSNAWWFVATTVLVVGGLTWLSHHPRVFNYPTQITEENAQKLYRIGEQLMVWVNASCAVVFAAISSMMVFGMNATPVIVLGLLGMTASVFITLARLLRVW